VEQGAGDMQECDSETQEKQWRIRRNTCVPYEEEDTCVSYEEEDTCVSYEEEDIGYICAT
jgi:hypothetical protein